MSNTYNVGWLRDNENQIFIPFTYTKSVKLDDTGKTLDSTVTTVGEHTDKISIIEEAIQDIENGTISVGIAKATKGTLTVGHSKFNGSDNITVTAKDLGITGALVYKGISVREITDGGIQKPLVIIDNKETELTDLDAGNIILYKNINSNIYQEFLWTGDHWELLGDEGSYALKSISINAGDGLEGGGNLEAEREIKVSPDGTTIVIDTNKKVAMPVQKNLTAGDYGQSENIANLQPKGTTTFNVPYITVDKYGRVTSASTKTIQVKTDTEVTDKISAIEDRSIIAGLGLTGGGKLTDSRTLNVGEGAGITVETDKISLSPSGVTSGDYGADVGDTTYHLSFNEELKIPYITVDQYGRVIAASTETVKMPDDTEINDLLTKIITDIAGDDNEVDNIVPRLAKVETRTKFLNAGTEDGVFQITDKDGYVGLQVDNNGTSSFDFILIKSEEESISLTEKLGELDSQDTQLGDSITDLNTNLNDKIDKVNKDLTETINAKEENLQKEIESTASTINTTIEQLQKTLEDKDTALQDSITTLTGREIIAGDGLTGGGNLAEDRTLSVNPDGTIIIIDEDTKQVTMNTSGVSAGVYGQSTEYKDGFDGSFTIPFIKIDQYGRITEATSITINMPSDDAIIDKISDLENVTISGGNGLSGSGKLSDGTITLTALVDRGLDITNNKIGHSNSIANGTINGTEGNVDFNGKIVIPKITYDDYGHITAVTTTEVTLPSITAITDAITTLETNSATKEQLTAATNNLQSQINTNRADIDSNDLDIEALQDKTADHDDAIVAINDINTQQNDTIGVLQSDVIILDTRTKYMDASAPDEFHIADEQGYPGFTFGADGIARAGDFITSSTTEEDNNISLKETKKALDAEIADREADQAEINDILSKMNITAGSDVKPIYFNDGAPTVCESNFAFYEEIGADDVDPSTNSTFCVLRSGDTMTGPLVGTGFVGPLTGNATTATKLETPRNFYISDNDGTNTGPATVFDGGGDATIKLPATIKADITGDISGNAATADKINQNLVIKLNDGSTEGTNLFTFNGSSEKTINITPASINAATSDHHHDSTYVNITGDTMTGNLKMSKGSLGYYLMDSSSTSYPAIYDNGSNLWIGATQTASRHHEGGTYISAGYNTSTGKGRENIFMCVPNDDNTGGTAYQIWRKGNSVTGAVWNDYAEYRESDCEEFGYVLMENGDDTLSKTTERLSHFAGVSSDTWGFSQGETDHARTPIAVAGRVLVYPYQNRNNYKPGDCVCAAPGGTVDIMTREEVINWPDRIVGTVSCVPIYEEWGSGKGADRPPVKVNNRIWIKVR